MAALRQSSTMGISDMMRSSIGLPPRAIVSHGQGRSLLPPKWRSPGPGPRAGSPSDPPPAKGAVVRSGAGSALRFDPPLAVVHVDAPGARTAPVRPDHEGAVGVAAEEAAPGVGGGARVVVERRGQTDIGDLHGRVDH